MRMILLLAAASLLMPLSAPAQEQTREFAPPIIKEKGAWAFSSYYANGTLKRGPRRGNWTFDANTLTYGLNDLLTPYVSVNVIDFLHDVDYAGNVGTYVKLEDGYLRSDIGWGGDIDYIYRFQARAEYERRLQGSLFWQVGARYLDYARNDLYLLYPGLIYYFGRNYLTGFYHYNATQGWGSSHWGSAQGNFALTRRLAMWLGTAMGERIFNVELLPASRQYGYMYFGGVDINVTAGAAIKLGYVYARQRPAIIRRSVEAGAIFKF